MDAPGENSDSGSNNKPDIDEDAKHPNVWGPFYLLLGLSGLVFSAYSVFHNFDRIVPLYGTVMTGVLVGAISVLILLYGYRVMRRDI